MAYRRSPAQRRGAAALRERFVAEYLIDLNGTQAYLRAKRGTVKVTTAEVESVKLLGEPKVAAAVKEGKARQLARLEMSASTVLELLWSAASLNPREMFDDNWRLLPLSKMTPAALRTIEGIEIARANLDLTDGKRSPEWLHKVKTVSKSKALEILARHFGLLIDKVEVSGEVDLVDRRLKAGRERARARRLAR